MLKKELLELLKDIEDEGEIDNLLKETDLYKSSTGLENFKNLVATDKDFKSFFDSEKDKHYSKALESWKKNNLPTLIEAEILKRNPKKDPLELKLEELERKLEQAEKQRVKAEKIAQYKDTLVEKKIPTELTNWLIADDDEVTQANIDLFENAMKQYIETGINTEVDKRFKGGANIPPKGEGEKGITKEEFAKMNLPERAKLQIDNPDLFKQLTEL